jgi:hypothetical protein
VVLSDASAEVLARDVRMPRSPSGTLLHVGSHRTSKDSP